MRIAESEELNYGKGSIVMIQKDLKQRTKQLALRINTVRSKK